MVKLLKSIAAPLLSLAIIMIAVGLFSTFVPLRLTFDGYNSFIVGGVTSAYFVGIAIGSLRIERIVSRVGLIRAFAALASMNSVMVITMGMFRSPVLWICLRFFMGAFTAGIYVIIESWLLMVGGQERKGIILAYYMIAFYAAQAGGQFLLNIASPMSFIPFSLATFFISLSVIPVCMTLSAFPKVERPSLINPFQLFKISAFGISSAFGSGLIMGSFFGLAPVFAHKVGMHTSEVATYMGLTIIGGFLLQWPLGKLSDLINRRSVLIGVSFITSIMALLIVLATYVSTNFLVVLSVLFGGFSFTMYPLSISYTKDFLDPKDFVAAAGGLLVSYALGSALGPLLAPTAMKIFGPAGLYLYFGLVASMIGFLGFYRRIKRNSTSFRQQSDFRTTSRTTIRVSERDPRANELVKESTSLEERPFIEKEESVVQSTPALEGNTSAQELSE